VLEHWPAALVWLAAWLAMWLLDGRTDLGNQALILVLASAAGAFWLPPFASLIVCAAAVLAFNFVFVPPRGTFSVDLHQHALLLVTMLAVSWTVALLMARQRQLAQQERMHRARAEQLRSFGEALRDAEDPRSRGPLLQHALSELTGSPPTLLMLPEAPLDSGAADACMLLGDATTDEKAGLWLSLRQSQAMGPGTGRHEEQGAWYVPMRGRHASFGAALLPLPSPPQGAHAVLVHAQALCDQMGLVLERAAALGSAAASREAAQAQALRNTLLAAIAHDHRTPLATVLGAASSLLEQDERLSPEQRRRLAGTIVDEATQLARLTDNTLQLARLDAPGLVLRTDWESVEEIVGTVLRRIRSRDPATRVKAHVEAGLPLLRCDAVLLVQLLDNLVDNALKHGGAGAPVEIVAHRAADRIVLAVRDRGPGVPPEWRSRIFEAFQRPAAATPQGGVGQAPARRGAGVGLALCRAIARVHRGELTLRARRHGGSSFELSLPLTEPPPGDGGVDEGAAS
jgi:two-component system sensor histidine kinase KdpD